MKFNLLLIFILILLGVFTYYFEELGQKEKKARDENLSRLIKPGELGVINEIKASNFHLTLNENKFVTSKGAIVSTKVLDKVYEVLSGIKIKRIIKENELIDRGILFSNFKKSLSFKFSEGSMKYTLGNSLSYSSDFYLEVESVVKNDKPRKFFVVAYDDSIDTNIYQIDQTSDNNAKYRRLQALFLLRESSLLGNLKEKSK